MHSDYYIYCYFRPDTGQPCYIGMGRRNRWRDHFRTSTNIRLARIIAKANKEIPHIKLHVGLTHDQANKYETTLIRAIGRFPNGPLVNMTDGGDGYKGGWKHSEEARGKMRHARAKLPNLQELMRKAFVASQSPEAREKSRLGRLGSKASPEARANQRLGQLGRKRSAESVEKSASKIRGRKLSPETKIKIATSLLGRKRSLEAVLKTAEANRGRKHTPEALMNMRAGRKPASEETRAKIRASKLGRKLSPEIVAKRMEAKQTLTVTTPENDHHV